MLDKILAKKISILKSKNVKGREGADWLGASIEVLEIEGALPEKKLYLKVDTELCTNHPLGLY